MRSVDISLPALTGCHSTDVTLLHPDAIPSVQPCWLPGMSKSSFLASFTSLTNAAPGMWLISAHIAGSSEI